MTAFYNGLSFKTPLEAHWAAFFDLAGWKWNVNPRSVGDWAPDFRVTFPCEHSECGGSHTLLISVLPTSRIEDLKSHPCLSYPFGTNKKGEHIGADAGAAFGASPKVTTWAMSHGAGGGDESVPGWVDYKDDHLWTRAAALVS